MPAYCYYVTSEILKVFKAGYWNGSLYKLWCRYATTYGPNVEFIIFECGDKPPNNCENYIHAGLKGWHYEFELFWKTSESSQAFIDAASEVCADFTALTNRSPIRNPSRERHKFSGLLTSPDTSELAFKDLPMISADMYMTLKKQRITVYSNTAIQKYLFIRNFVEGSPSPVSTEYQAALFDDFQHHPQHKLIIVNVRNMCRQSPTHFIDKNLQEVLLVDTNAVKKALISDQIRKLVRMLHLKSIHDIETIVTRAILQENLQEFLKIINKTMKLLSKPSIAIEDIEEDTSGDLRKVTRGLQTVFSTWLGLNIVNVAPRGAQSNGERTIRLQLAYKDDFSKRLYISGIV